MTTHKMESNSDRTMNDRNMNEFLLIGRTLQLKQEAGMKILHTSIWVFCIFAVLSLSMPSLSYGQGGSSSAAACAQARKDYMAAEQQWSSLNAEVQYLRDQVEKLHSLRWDSKITLSVLEDASRIIKDGGGTSSCQRLTLNSRIPSTFGKINPDGSFHIEVLETAPLEVDEAHQRIQALLSWTEEDLKKTDAEVKAKEQQSHRLRGKLAELEDRVEGACKAAGANTPWEQGIPRLSGGDIYQRYVDRERLRQQEVESRAYASVDRYWVKRHYASRHRDFPSSAAFPSRCMLIRLKNIDGRHSSLRCFPFSSPWRKRWILEELDNAAHHHEQIPGVGKLGAYHLIDVFDDVAACYERLF